MLPSREFVTETFNKYNKLIFNSSLPIPRFIITTARSFRGKLVYTIQKINKKEYHDFEMRISRNFDLPATEWEDVVIHEMIHLHIAFHKLEDSSSHGPVFRQLMHTINHAHGRHINVSARSDAATSADSQINTAVKAHYICVAKFNDGRLGVAPVAKTRVFQLWDYFTSFPNVVSLKWVGTLDVWFNGFPHVRKPKFFIVKESVLRPHLKGGVLLQREGNIIKIISRQCYPDELLP